MSFSGLPKTQPEKGSFAVSSQSTPFFHNIPDTLLFCLNFVFLKFLIPPFLKSAYLFKVIQKWFLFELFIAAIILLLLTQCFFFSFCKGKGEGENPHTRSVR